VVQNINQHVHSTHWTLAAKQDSFQDNMAFAPWMGSDNI